jgi:hypothetical protein
VASRQSLKLASSVRFTPSQPLPGRSAAGRCSLTADVDGSSPRLRAFPHPGSHFFAGASFKGKDTGLRTRKLQFDSVCAYQSAIRPMRTGRGSPKAGIPVRIRSGRPVPDVVQPGRKPRFPGSLGREVGYEACHQEMGLENRELRRQEAFEKITRGWPIGKALRCLRRLGEFESRSARQIFLFERSRSWKSSTESRFGVRQ